MAEPNDDIQELVSLLHADREAAGGEAAARIAMATMAAVLDFLENDPGFGRILLDRLSVAARECPPGVANIVRVAAVGAAQRTGCDLPPIFCSN